MAKTTVKRSGSRYHELLVTLIKRLLRQNPMLTRDDLADALKSARGASGGYARAANRAPEPAAASLADDADEDSFEELIGEVQDAVQATFGGDAWTVATYPDFVIFYHGSPTQPDGDDDPDDAIDPFDNAWEEAVEDGLPDGDNDADDQETFCKVVYSRDADGVIVFGQQTTVEKDVSWVAAGGEDDGPDSYEEEIDELEDALGAMYGNRVRIVASYPDRVIYCLGGANGDATYFEQPYTEDEQTEKLTFGDRTEVTMSVAWSEVAAEEAARYFVKSAGVSEAEARNLVKLAYTKAGASGSAKGGKRTLPANVQKLPENLQKAWVDVFNKALKNCGGEENKKCEQMAFRMANGVLKKAKGRVAAEWGDTSGAVALAAAKFTDKPWNGAASRWPDPDAYCRAALIDLNPPGKPKSKDLCKLPYKEPDGTVNKGALRAIASALAGGRGGVKGVSPPALAAAKKKHAALMQQAGIGDDSTKAEAAYVLDSGTQTRPLPSRLRALDWQNAAFTPVALRLSSESRPLPVWQQLHKIGSWAMPHASGQKIALTRDMGNRIIENFRRGVVRRGVPLDYRHFTDSGGEALGWLEEVRWGSEGQGLLDGPEPDGTGPILYGRFNYNNLGVEKLSNSHYRYISPQYFLNYPDAETGQRYGPALVAVAATNSPYLRIRSIQGDPAPEPVAVLEDGLIPWEDNDMVDQVKLDELQARLEATEKALADERRARHVATVEAFLDAEMRGGLPPALAKLAKPLLLHSTPDAEAVISLSDEDATPTHNLHDAMKTLVREIPKMPVGQVLTHQDNARPYDGTGRTALDDQLAPEKVSEYVQELYKMAGIDGANRDAVLLSTARRDGDG